MLAIVCWNNEALFRLGLTLCFGAFGCIAVWHVISDYIATRKRQTAMIPETQEPTWEIAWQPVDTHIGAPNLNSQPVTPLPPSYYYEPVGDDEDSTWDSSDYLNDDSDDDYWYESEPEPYLEDLLDEYFELGILDDMCEKGNLF